MNKKVLLMILDGWGEGKHDHSNVIYNAHTPFFKKLYTSTDWKYCRLNTCGEEVGLPEGQMGNSEVGHLNIGAGRIIFQDFVRINIACRTNSIAQNQVLADAFSYAIRQQKQVHFIGLVSDGGVHSSTEHLKKLCSMATDAGLSKVFIHALTDGRDTDPYSGKQYLTELEDFLKQTNAKVASVCGRYYTMDRDKRWERVSRGYELMVNGTGKPFLSSVSAIEDSYQNGITDEFIEPSVITDSNGNALTTIQPDDVVICFNFRTDRLREITTVLTQKDMPEFSMRTIPLYYLTMTRYDEKFKNIHIIFDKEDLSETLGEVVSNHGLTQLRIAETEKYPHVTFFFSGGREEVFEGEQRIMIPSPKVATYDLQPSMSAVEVKNAVLEHLQKGGCDFICLNFANADMVGHTGVYDAIRQAVETVDSCVSEIVPLALKKGYSIIITADHGNADYAVNSDGTPNTAHSLNQVPLFLYDKDVKNLKPVGRLANIAPTILKILGISAPSVMEDSLFE